MENNKTQAEILREERKQRLAKAAEKNAMKSPKSAKTRKMQQKVIAIVLAVVIGLSAIVGGIMFFEIPQKTIKIAVDSIDSLTEVEKISLAEINYYYFQNWSQMYSTSAQYEQYGEGMGLQMTGFDYTKAPDKQEYSDDFKNVTGVSVEDLGDIENPTWADVLTYSAFSQVIYVKYGAAKAEEAGIELTEDELKAIDTEMEDIRKAAEQNDYSVNRWLSTQVGAGVTEKLVRELEIKTQLATKFYEKYTDDSINSVTADDIDAEYAASKKDYDVVDLRIYGFKPVLAKDHVHDEGEDHDAEHAEAEKKAKENADAFYKSVKDEASFIAAAKKDILTADPKSEKDPDKETLIENKYIAELKSSYGEKVAEWAFDASRKAGDVAVITEESGTSYVVMIKALPEKDTSLSSADVRHILAAFPDKNTDGTPTSVKDSNGNTVSKKITDETKKATKEKAQAVLDEYLKNPTEDNFIKLCKEKTDDTNSKETGGLIAGIADNGKYVESFTNWSMDTKRKPGDVEIIESEYGFHLMYYAKSNEPAWYLAVKNKLANDIIENGVAKEIEEINKGVERNTLFVNWTIKNQNKHIGRILLNMGLSSHAGHNH